VTAGELCTRLWTGYLEAVKSVKPGKVAGWFAMDAALIYHGMAEIRSRDSIEAFMAKVLPGRRYLELDFTLEHFDVVGSKAYTFVTLNELVEVDGQPKTRYRTRCGAVWQQQADNTYQISHCLISFQKL
jgi:ketosteroid isomerase-like protein